MPPQTRIAAQLARKRASEPFICPTCAFRTFFSSSQAPRQSRRRLSLRSAFRRYASTVASATTINAPLEVPVAFRELHEALNKLKVDASIYVNLSRLQLALRGLEGSNVRVAVLSSDKQQLASTLAKLLAADPLNQAEEWEKSLEDSTTNDGRAVLIRYGDPETPIPSNPLLRTILTTSPFLRTHNLELLLSTITLTPSTASTEPTTATTDAFLVPTLQAPNSSSGHVTNIALPVHKTLLLGSSPNTLIAFGRHTASTPPTALPPSLLKLVILMPTHRAASEQSPAAAVVALDLDLAAAALSSFRKSFDNAIEYERGWFASGAGCVAEWVAEGTAAASDGALKGAVAALVESVLEDAEARIAAAEVEGSREWAKGGVEPEVRRELLGALEKWAEASHGELQASLEEAFESRAWKGLAWWKLFWRVDDVGAVANEVLERRWLVESEKGLVFLAGRCEQVGMKLSTLEDSSSTPARTKVPETEEVEDERSVWDRALPQLKVEDLYTEKERRRILSDGKDYDEEALPMPKPKSYPQTLAATRARLSQETVPPLQALAQTLVLQAYSTTFLTTSLSALAYFGISTTSVYEAGVVAAFGLVWSLRRLQSKWEAAKVFWRGEVREEGRVTLREAEETGRRAIQEGGRGKEEDGMGRKDVEKARAAVRRAREKLDMVRGD